MTPDAVHVHSKLRRNSLVNDHEDIALLREKLTRIAVGRLHGAFVNRAEVMETKEEEEEGEGENERQGRRSNKTATQHFKVFSSLLPERSNTPPSSPQPRDVLKKQLKLKQQVSDSRIQSTRSWVQEDDGRCEAMVSVEDLEIMPVKDIVGGHVATSPSWTGDKQSPRARMSIPGHLRALSPFNVFKQHPEGLRKRKCVDAPQDGLGEPRASLKKTSSQINILVTSAGSLSRSSSTGREFLQTLAARQRLEQDHDMEDVGFTTQPQSPQNAHFGSKHGQLSACS
uniref:Uncharacterized protein n=1 Tax=Hyaloperonospora arabidopsidis (strain Emoy2) TaxID=559515 RepID=M4BRE4_HYAAE